MTQAATSASEGTSSLRSSAATLRAQGFCVLPLDGDGQPRVDPGEFRDRPPSDAAHAAWFADARTVRMGLLCGRVSGLAMLVIHGDDEPPRLRDALPEDLRAVAPWHRINGGEAVWLRLPRVLAGAFHVLARGGVHLLGERQWVEGPSTEGVLGCSMAAVRDCLCDVPTALLEWFGCGDACGRGFPRTSDLLTLYPQRQRRRWPGDAARDALFRTACATLRGGSTFESVALDLVPIATEVDGVDIEDVLHTLDLANLATRRCLRRVRNEVWGGSNE